MEKIKSFIQSEKGKDVLTVLIVILIGIGSFELGRISKESPSQGLKIQYRDQNDENDTNIGESYDKPINILSSESKKFFASSKGSKYYTISCGAGKTIKQENRIYFATGDEAKAAGYELSSSCY